MRRIDIFVSSPEDVRKERSVVERTIRAIALEFGVPITVTYSNWLRQRHPSDKISISSANGSEDGRTWLCPCFWEYRDSELDQEYREQIPNTGSYDLVISILWARLGTKISPAFVMPDGSQPKTANEYEIGWVLDQVNRTPGFPELRVYRNRSAPHAPLLTKPQRDAFFREWDAVQEFFAAWENKKAFSEACSSYSDLEEFESLFRAHFRDFLSRQLEKEIVPRKRRAKKHCWESESFRGLEFFDFEHARIFHGRTKAVGQVVDALAKQANSKTPFVLVLGSSGSGKSSLVRAGVLPMLMEAGTMAGEGPWRYAVTRPGFGGDPFDSLAAALLAETALPELVRAKRRDPWRKLSFALKEDPDKVALRIKELLDRISAQELNQLLNNSEDQTTVPDRIESTELLRHRKLRRGKPRVQIALFIDQLEDLFSSGYSLALQRQYLAAVAALVRCQRVYVIAALESGYYASYREFPELVALTSPNGQFDLQPPTAVELGKMIRSPAEAAGLRFEYQAKTGQRLDDALIDAALASADQLPLLEHLLSMLCRKQVERGDGLLRWSDYTEMGGFDGALAYHAEEVFSNLSSDAQQAFDFVMRRLAPNQLHQLAGGRVASYQDLVSSPELEKRLKAGARSLVDCMVIEGLLTSETDIRQQIMIRVAHPALFRIWPRMREWLVEDQEFLRMRDRLDGCLKLWLKQGRKTRDLLNPGHGLADGETLLSHFRSSLSNTQIEYIHKSLAGQKRGRTILYLVWLPILAALVSLVVLVGYRWFNTESLRGSIQDFGKLERKIGELANTDHAGNQAAREEAGKKTGKETEIAHSDALLSAAQRAALETQLKQARDKLQQTQQNAEIYSSQRVALETQLKQAQDKLRQAQQDADSASKERSALETELKQSQDKLQQAQRNSELASSQRSALEAKLKESQDKLQQAQQNLGLGSDQLPALQAQLKRTEDELQQAQQSADLASNQRGSLEAQLKQTQEKLQQAQQSADVASSQRGSLEAQLKQAQEKLQQAEQSADVASSQRGSLEAQLKQAQEKLQQAQQSADVASNQRGTLEAQLEQAQEKLQQAQQNADLASSQRADFERQFKQAQEKLQQAQQNADLALSQRAALESRLKKAEENLQGAKEQADLASAQRAALETQLREVEAKAQLAQKIADLVAAQAHPEENGKPKGESAVKHRDLENQPRSGRALPLDVGQNPDPGTSTESLTPPVQTGGH